MLGINLGLPFDLHHMQHKPGAPPKRPPHGARLFRLSSAPFQCAPQPPERTWFGDTCPRDVLVLVFQALARGDMTIVQYKVIGMVCRRWAAVLRSMRVVIATPSLQSCPAFALVNPAASPTMLYAAWTFSCADNKYTEERFLREAPALFTKNPKLCVRVHARDLRFLDPAAVCRWGGRIVMPHVLPFHMGSTNYQIDPTFIVATARVFSALRHAGVLSESHLLPYIETDPDIAPGDAADEIRLFVSQVNSLFGVKPLTWGAVLVSYDPFMPRRTKRETLYPPPGHSKARLFQSALRHISIPASALDLVFHPSALLLSFLKTGKERLFFSRLIADAPMPTFTGVATVTIHLTLFCSNMTWMHHAPDLRDALPTTCIEPAAKRHPGLTHVRYYLTGMVEVGWRTPRRRLPLFLGEHRKINDTFVYNSV